jgi:alpha-beta hydrolase superfamily lysophospholipase
MQKTDFTINTCDGLRLHGRRWEPAEQARAVVCLVHGLGEHCGRYDHVAERFNRAGYTLQAFDLRGHGKSDGKRGHAPDYAALMSDITALLNSIPSRFADCKQFLYGHSLGGNLVIHYALHKRPELAGVIASSPLFRPASKPPAWKIAILRTMYNLRPALTLSSGLEDLALSRDLNVVHLYRNDPLVHDRISARLAMDMLDFGKWNQKQAHDFPLPLLLVHGDADRITASEATCEFAAQTRADCTLKIYEGLYHELHNEPEKGHVLADILDWMLTYS